MKKMDNKPLLIAAVVIVVIMPLSLLVSFRTGQAGQTEDANKIEILKKIEGTWNVSFRDSRWRTRTGCRKISFHLEGNELLVTDYYCWENKIASAKIPLEDIRWSNEEKEKELWFSYRFQHHIKPTTFRLSQDGKLRGLRSTVTGGILIEVFLSK